MIKFGKESEFLDFLHQHKCETTEICSIDQLCIPQATECTDAVCKYIDRLYASMSVKEVIYYVEVGVQFGRTFSFVLDYCKRKGIQIQAIAIDLFEDFVVEHDNTHKGDVADAASFERKLRELGHHNITIIKGDSHQRIKELPPMKYGIGFIDGNHTYEYVKGDYEFLLEKIENGFIVLDDICPYWMGVHQFWNELPATIKIETIGRGWEIKGVTRVLH